MASAEEEKRVVQVPCMSCGRLVTIVVPFIGCVFCGDCITPRTWQTQASTEQFIKRDWPQKEVD